MSCASFGKVASYIWAGAEYSHMDVDGASGDISTMWNLNSIIIIISDLLGNPSSDHTSPLHNSSQSHA